MRAAWRAVLLAALGGMALPAAPASEREPADATGSLLRGQPPPAGRYDAVLCVSVGAAPADCGPVSADIGGAGQALVRVSDIAYRLERSGEQLGVSLFHGTMQVDGFFAPYQWSGQRLQFSDPDKPTRYELTLGTRRFDAP
ncbi:MAG TPA: hypothetical protein PKB14_16885 [Rubrivivax sp.]|nr:hypothetical protein [Rubrivivax sp.]